MQHLDTASSWMRFEMAVIGCHFGPHPFGGLVDGRLMSQSLPRQSLELSGLGTCSDWMSKSEIIETRMESARRKSAAIGQSRERRN